MPKAYSYLRFSTTEQKKGLSEDRQTKGARRYADAFGLDLDAKLTFKDLGVSGFEGANAKTGRLGAFLAAVESKQIEKGSYLLLENFDRLSRMNPWDALPIFQQLINAGINIVTLSNNREWNLEGLKKNPYLLQECVSAMTTANAESEMKRFRGNANWRSKRERALTEGHNLTSKVPGWLKLNKAAKKIELIKPRAEIVKRIFLEYLAGTGAFTIARRLNADAVPTFGKADAWHEVYIQKILHNEAAYGNYQPKRRYYVDGKAVVKPEGPVLKEYFPAVVSEADFNRAQALFPAATGKKGRPLANVFSGLVFCSSCQGRMNYNSKGTPNSSYLHCDTARRRRTCNAKSVRYGRVESAVMDAIDNPVYPLANMQKPSEDRRKELERLIGIEEASIAAEKAAIEKLLAAIETGGDLLALRQRLEKRTARQAELEASVSEMTRELKGLSADPEAAIRAQAAMKQLWLDVARMPQDKKWEFVNNENAHLNGAYKLLIDRIEIGPEQATLRLKGTDETMVVVYPDKPLERYERLR